MVLQNIGRFIWVAKILPIIAMLIEPSVAYGASTSANISIQVLPAGGGQPTLSLVVTPPALTIPPSTPLSANLATLQGVWSDGSPFTGGYVFAPPNYDFSGTYAVSGSNLIIDPNGPGVGSAGGTVQHATMEAIQLDPTADGVTSTAPSGPPLRNSAGYWSWSQRQIGSNYVLYLNGQQHASSDSATLIEVANGGQLYANTTTGWYRWDGTTFVSSAAPTGGGGGSPTPPAGAVAAGFTTLAANFDFTQNQMCIAGSCVAASPKSNWLDCAGASPPMWWLDGGVQVCNEVVLTTDGGIPVMDLQFLRSLFASNYNTASILTSDTSKTNVSFSTPQGKYYEIKARITSVPSDCPLEPTNHCLFADAWAYGPVGGGTTPFIEWDFIEMFSATGQNGAGTLSWNAASWNWNGPLSAAEPGNQGGYNPNAYNIYGVRATTNGTGNYGECLYLNNTFTGCQTATGSNSANVHRNMLVLWSGSAANVQLNSDSNLYIQWIRVWECAGWATGECNGTVLSGPP